MDNMAGLGVALAAMWSDDENRYEGYAMLSALPGAPTDDRPTLRDRVHSVGTAVLKPLAARLRRGAQWPSWLTWVIRSDASNPQERT